MVFNYMLSVHFHNVYCLQAAEASATQHAALAKYMNVYLHANSYEGYPLVLDAKNLQSL